jgi:NhaP-type Na+/H+ or K+/H+ antiporter
MSSFPSQGPQQRRRRELRDRRLRSRLARVDLLIGLAVAAVVLLVSPGLAISGFVALLLLAAVAASIGLSGFRRRRSERSAWPRARR